MTSHDQGRLIFRHEMRPIFWPLPLIAGAAVLFAAASDNAWEIALWLVPFAVIVALLILWGAIWLTGRETLARVVLAGDMLICRRADLFNRGALVTLALAETTAWSRYRRPMRYGWEDGIQFHHDQSLYRLPLTDAQYADAEVLEKLLGKGGAVTRRVGHAMN